MLTIYLDPGHGTKKKVIHKDSRTGLENVKTIIDIGTTGYQNKFNESENNMAIAHELEKILTSMGHVVVMSRREKDDGLSLSERGSKAKKSEPSIAISIHCDAAQNTQAYEMRTYYRASFGKNSDDFYIAFAIASSAPKELKKVPCAVIGCMPKMQALPSGVAPRAYNVLREHGEYPSILVECGFLTNPFVAEYLSSDNGRRECAFSIASGIQSWFKNKTAFSSPIAFV